MERRINWLHFTDLHYGQRGQNILLPKIKRELFKDIEYIKEQIGNIDIVFFTGDLSQSGKKEEFDELTAFLNELWSHFNKLGSNPYFIAIPGNHDLTRPDASRAVVKVLRNYNSDLELHEDLWIGLANKGEFYDLINNCFLNFNNWYKGINLPKPQLTYGLVPGDIAATININNVKLNILGLNTAFLELSSDNYLGKLAINPSQINALIGANPLDWVEDADVSLLLTHHDPQWYDQESKEFYNNDINPPNAFYSHLCGHLHEANTYQYRLVGSDFRKIQLAPSLFGLQKTTSQVDRIHGYYAGSYILQDESLNEIFYPRRANKRYDDNYGIDSDTGFHLNKLGFLEFTQRDKKIPIDETSLIEKVHSAQLENNENPTLNEVNILDINRSQEYPKEFEQIPRVSYNQLPQHANIRLIEQNKFLDLISNNRLAWLITDWGLDESGFIGSVANSMQLKNVRNNFILNCEDIINDAELIEAFNEQFGMSLQRFCNLSLTLDRTLLIFDHVDSNLYATNNSYSQFSNIINSILDYCPQMLVIVISRQIPSLLLKRLYVKLFPLDSAQIKSYVENHPGNTRELDDADNLLKLIEITSGLPIHIERIIDNLKIATFEEVLEMERETPVQAISENQIPKAIRQAIGILSNTTDRLKLRSFKLLKILTLLSNGETLGNLSRFDATEPIYLPNATELERLGLLEISTSTIVLSKVSAQPIKILRVPRQIRDYVNTLITENERDDILRHAREMYFGHKWREGNIKGIYGTSVFGSNKFFNVDNCHLILSDLMASALKNGDEVAIERASIVAINFCHHVYKGGDYKNTISTSEEIYNWLKPTNYQRSKAIIAKILGEALRMIGNNEKSNLMLNEALNMDGGQLSNSDKNEIYVELGYTYIKQLRNDKAIECAKAIEKTATPKDAHSIQAKYILAQATLSDDALLRRIKSLETEAKRTNLPKLVNTLSLKITELSDDQIEKEKRFNKVITSPGDDYNKIRAIIKKSIVILNGDGFFSSEDLHLLNQSYSYLYPQRLESLFDNCHMALWQFCLKAGRYQDLLNLFKHSSLVWRISGKIDLEKSYFEKLEVVLKDHLNIIKKDSVDLLNIDYYNRRKLEYNSQTLIH